MPSLYEYTYFSKQKLGLDPELRTALNTSLTGLRQGSFNTAKKVAGNGQTLVKKRVNFHGTTDVWETRINGHWRIFYYTNPGGNLTLLSIGHLDPNSRLMEP